MARKRIKELVTGPYFTWRVGRRSNGVFYADGRSNKINLGRPSLGTRDWEEALEILRKYDQKMAVKHGLANQSILETDPDNMLSITDGIKLYLDHTARPLSMGGATKATRKRYQAVFDKFKSFAEKRRVRYWQSVTSNTVEQYGKWLEDQGYAQRTIYLEVTTIIQAIKWFTRKDGEMPESCQVSYELKKQRGTNAYCYTDDEVRRIIQSCYEKDDLRWLGDIVVGLVYTGLRISELAQLRWSDINLETNVLRLRDNRQSRNRKSKVTERTTKNHDARSLPIHPELCKVLKSLSRHDDGRVFHGPRGGAVKSDTVRSILLREIINPLKRYFPVPSGELGFADGRVHTFRHYFCSMCAGQGIPELTVKLWLGHRDSNMIKHYYHLHDETAQIQMKKIKSVGGPGAA